MADTPFSQWTERLKVYNDFIRALAEYKKSSAEADVLEAQRLGLLEEAKAKALVVRQLSRDLQRLTQVRNRIQKETEHVDRRQRDAAVILRGVRVDVVSLDRAWRAYRTFEAQALKEDVDSLFEISVPSDARTPDNFIDVRRDQMPDAVPDKLDNAIMLAAWLQGKRYMAAAGRPAQRIVARLFSAIDNVAQSTVDELQTRLKEMEAKTYDAWKPVSILGVPSGAVDKQIQEAGARAAA